MCHRPSFIRALKWGAATVLVLALAWVVVFLNRGTDRELLSLPAAERRALYQRTLETLRLSCVHAEGPKLSEYCWKQAEFVVHFPECDRECHALARQCSPKPTRMNP